MTVQKVKDAAAVLGVDADTLTHDELTKAYRAQAKKRHPDHGGTAEEFRELMEASAILNKHLTRRAPQRGKATPCDHCGGTGVVLSRRAWRTMRVRCPVCKGTGASPPVAV